MPSPAATFEEVRKTFRSRWRPGGTVHALRDVSLTIQAGEVFALLGPNRAGKTTLIKILLGLCHPSGGRVERLGLPLHRRETLARVGYMHENQAFPRYLTAHSLLEFYGNLSQLAPAALKQRVPALLEQVGLADRAGEPIARFSKGMVQRLALAQALLTEPDLLVFDEPMEGLDLDARQALRDVIGRQRRYGKTVLIVSHALGDITGVCDRVAVLVDGRLAHCGAMADLLRDPANGGTRTLEAALKQIYQSHSKEDCPSDAA
jgi:ABC-2 type transport system ATP-binding protein